MSGVTYSQLRQIEQTVAGAHGDLRSILDQADFHAWRGADADRWRSAFQTEVLDRLTTASRLAGSLSIEPY